MCVRISLGRVEDTLLPVCALLRNYAQPNLGISLLSMLPVELRTLCELKCKFPVVISIIYVYFLIYTSPTRGQQHVQI